MFTDAEAPFVEKLDAGIDGLPFPTAGRVARDAEALLASRHVSCNRQKAEQDKERGFAMLSRP